MTELGSKEEASENYQKEPDDLPLGIAIQGISKIFSTGFQLGRKKKIVAVNSLSLNLYEGHITIIVGRNGAGKTTTL